ncbi:hypothetical protein C7C46_04765 [Streptomyces tateyamensis]|uniref:Uncharacterized protein n=1 Tax=Streptomyces tateyamensis TaxID=565073 RepID=A0A2V4NLV3_9ACTN|nr:hypothetical protein C7C46_04765 [Streptomyces tateyamensis]
MLTLAAVVLLVEALVVGLIGLVLGFAASRQHMVMGGIASSRIALASWVGQGSLAVFLLVCAVVVAVTAGRPQVRLFVRVLLVLCAVLNGVLMALMLALSGWPAFCLLAVVTGVLVLVLVYERPSPVPAAEPVAAGNAVAEPPIPLE